MRKLLIILFLLILALPVQSATMVSGRPCPGGAGVAPSCTTPTGDELTESFGDASSSCWSGGDSTCDNTWAVAAGTLGISDVPASAPANTACTKGLLFNAAENIYFDLGDGTIANNVQTVINFTLYIDSSSVAAYSQNGIVSLNATNAALASSSAYVAVMLARPTSGTGVATKIKAVGTNTCYIPFAEDTWYNITITLDAEGAENGSTLSDGTNSCNFTRDTDASRYVHVGAAVADIVGYIGNIRVSTP